MGKLAEGNRKLGAQLKVQGGAAGVRGGEPRAAAAASQIPRQCGKEADEPSLRCRCIASVIRV